jgi:bifunctional non-homologous end joining protein LigD
VIVGYYRAAISSHQAAWGPAFTDAMLVEMARPLEPLARAISVPFAGGHVPKETKFVEPRLVYEVEFTEWTTRSGELRHPSFKGLRWDKTAKEVVREAAVAGDSLSLDR